MAVTYTAAAIYYVETKRNAGLDKTCIIINNDTTKALKYRIDLMIEYFEAVYFVFDF